MLLPLLLAITRVSCALVPQLGSRSRAPPLEMAAQASAADELVDAAIASLQPRFAAIDRRTEHSLGRLLATFRKHGIGSHHFAGVDGYGHGDLGREALDAVFADLMGAEAALVRVQCFSGTHAIACALYGVLRPGDELLGVSGAPYDTLEEVIGLRGGTDDGLRGTLADFGVSYAQVELATAASEGGDGAGSGGGDLAAATFDLPAIEAAITRATRMVHVQRSCGYSWRASISVAEIGRLAAWLREAHPQIVLFVDNCYGEFVEEMEPCAVGAHLVAGSLIKNPGGTLAPSGGYIAGRADLVAAAGRRLSAPGVEGGATLGMNRLLFQGLFNSPQVVGEALKGAELVAECLSRAGCECNPRAGDARTDIIQAVTLGSRERVVAFCEAVQRNSPVGAHIKPIPGVTPGYGDEVIFADGTFIDGSTLELSADGPLRAPYAVYLQGGTHWTHWALVLRDALEAMGMTGLADGPGGEEELKEKEASEARRYAGRRSLKND